MVYDKLHYKYTFTNPNAKNLLKTKAYQKRNQTLHQPFW